MANYVCIWYFIFSNMWMRAKNSSNLGRSSIGVSILLQKFQNLDAGVLLLLRLTLKL